MDPISLRTQLQHLYRGKGIAKILQNPRASFFGKDDYVFFDKVYSELYEEMKFLKIDEVRFFEEIFEAFDRYKKFKNLDPFTPVDKKARKNIREYLVRSFREVYKNMKATGR